MTTERVLFTGRWLGIKEVCHLATSTEMVFRPYSKEKGLHVQGVEIVPIIKYCLRPPELVLVAVYRPPVGSYVLEFPSGIAETADIEACAREQLRQETGYHAETILDASPLLMLDTRKSDENQHILVAMIDGDRHGPPVQELEHGEHIVVHSAVIDHTLHATLQKLQLEHGYQIEGKLWTVAAGLALNSLLKTA